VRGLRPNDSDPNDSDPNDSDPNDSDPNDSESQFELKRASRPERRRRWYTP
jgi:hypothetical protein